jgi:hypothetical protein
MDQIENKDLEENKLKKFFYKEKSNHLIHKWSNYFDIYDKHFNKFIGKNPIILEIGVFKGGSIDMWNYYFDNNCTIYAIDINEECLKLQKDFGDNVHIIIGDQNDDNFWKKFLEKNINFDIIIDDGSHVPKHQIRTLKKMYNYLKNGGIYLCEDICTSYTSDTKTSFVEFCKSLIDNLNIYHIPDHNNTDKTILKAIDFKKKTFSLTFYDNIVVIDKLFNERSYEIKKIINNDDNTFEIRELKKKLH